jgi:hypothetical protein
MYAGMRKYGVETTFNFAVYNPDGVDLDTDWVPAVADCEIMKDEGTSTQCTNTAVDEGVTYSITLTATEMQCARGVIKIQDAATKVILDIVMTFDTYGHASAQHAIDLDDAVRAGLTALPNAAADAAGGLIISTAGTTDADDIITNIATAQSDLDIITDTDGVILGAAGVDLIWDEPLTSGTHNVTNSSGKRIRDLQESGAVYGGFIWFDSVNGTAGSESYINGTSDNPCSTEANINTLASALGISRVKIAPGSTLTLTTTQNNRSFEGEAWTLALGSQNIDGCTFRGASVSGISTNTSDSQFFIDCIMGAVTLPGDTHCINCGLAGTQTMGEAGDYFYDACHSAIAGSGSVTIDFNTPGTETNLNVRHHSGGWTVANMGAGAGTCNASFEGNGQIVWAASCAATSNASIRGNWKITDNASGAVTETLDDNSEVLKNDMVFTKANELDVSVHSVNDVTIVGDGAGTPFNV